MLPVSPKSTADVVAQPGLETGDTDYVAPPKANGIPYINNTWVDACIVENNAPNCDPSAQQIAANAWCNDYISSGMKANGFSTEDAGRGHYTWRYTLILDHEHIARRWVLCDGCGLHFTGVNCVRSALL